MLPNSETKQDKPYDCIDPKQFYFVTADDQLQRAAEA